MNDSDANDVLNACASICAERAWRLAYSLMRNAADAEDVVQNAFVVAASRRESLPAADPWPWFATVVANVARNALRKRNRGRGLMSVDLATEALEGNESPERELVKDELRSLIAQHMEALPENERQAIVLAHVGGMEQAAAAEVMGISLRRFKYMLHRGIERLRNRLKPKEDILFGCIAAIPVEGPAGGITAAAQRWMETAGTVAGQGGAAQGVAYAKQAGGLIMGKKIAIAVVAALLVLLAGGIVYVTTFSDSNRFTSTGVDDSGNQRRQDDDVQFAATNPTNRQESHGSDVGRSEGSPGGLSSGDTEIQSNPSHVSQNNPMEDRSSSSQEEDGATNDPSPAAQDVVSPLMRLGVRRFNNGGPVSAAAFSPDGLTIASASWGGGIRLWSAETGYEIKRFDTQRITTSTDVMFTSDGRYVISGGDRGDQGKDDGVANIHVWDVSTGTIVRALGLADVIALSPDDACVLGGKKAKNGKVGLILWETPTGNVFREFEFEGDEVSSVAFAPSGRNFATTSLSKLQGVATRAIQVWSLDRQEPLHTWKQTSKYGPNEPLPWEMAQQKLAFRPDGQWLAVGSTAGSISFFELGADEATMIVRHPEKKDRLGNPVEGCRGLAWNPDGTRLLSAGGRGDNSLYVWDTVKGELVFELKGHSDGLTCVAFSPDGRRAASGSGDGTLQLWDVNAGAPWWPYESVPQGHSDRVRSVAYTSDGATLVSLGGTFEQGELFVWDPAKGAVTRTMSVGYPTAKIANVSGASSIVTAHHSSEDDRNTLSLWEPESGSRTDIVTLHRSWIDVTAMSPSGEKLLSASRDLVVLWDLKSRSNVLSTLPPAPLKAAWFSTDEKNVFLADERGVLHRLDIESGEMSGRVALQTGGKVNKNMLKITPSPDGENVLVYYANALELYHAASGKLVRVFKDPDSALEAWTAVFTNDGKRVLSGGRGGTVTLWDVELGTPVRKYIAHEGNIDAIAISPDEKTFATGSTDKTIGIWKFDR